MAMAMVCAGVTACSSGASAPAATKAESKAEEKADESKEETGGEKKDGYVIGLAMNTQTNPFFVDVKDVFRKRQMSMVLSFTSLMHRMIRLSR